MVVIKKGKTKAKGKTKSKAKAEFKTCPVCHGTGREEFNLGFLSRKCSNCEGTGKVKKVDSN
jgi:DnaJ-class molecular chaperone